MQRPILYLLALTALTSQAGKPPAITTAEANARCETAEFVGENFVLSGRITASVNGCDYVLEDATGRAFVFAHLVPKADLPLHPLGARVTVDGKILLDDNGNRILFYKHIRLLDRGPEPLPISASVAEATAGNLDLKTVRLKGLVTDIDKDDVDPNNAFLILSEDGASIRHTGSPKDFRGLLGAEIELTGIVRPHIGGWRVYIDRSLQAVDGFKTVHVLTPPPADPFAVPELESPRWLTSQTLSHIGRRRVTGCVLAAWQGNRILLHTGRGIGKTVMATLSGGQPLPRPDDIIQVVGQPDTDFFSILLHNARWRPAARPADRELDPKPPQDISPKELFRDDAGRPRFMAAWHGRAVRFSGILRNVSAFNPHNAHLYVESDGQIVTVDASGCAIAAQNALPGSTVEICGVCCLQTEAWQRDARIPRITGISVILRTPDDIRVLARPPWWTGERLSAVIGALLALLLAIIGWNVSLNRRAKAKGQELAAEQLAHVTSELKVNERTRLAVELHDALSQTLTGVSMQIDTAAGAAEGKMPTVTRCLHLASRTIDACRMELRNTLWDLRSAALDEPSMDAAIRKTLCQNLTDIDLSVRFNVAREVFSDNTAHVLLKIIRELATNALRHGTATSLKIAGAIKGDKLLFSVKDNGCGFDPDLAPGIAQGHFGLQGVAERLERLNGEMTIDSAPGKGTKVTVTLAIPRSEV